MLAQGPTCALARVSYMTSTRAKAHNKRYLSGPILHRDMAPFYSAIDRRLYEDKWLHRAAILMGPMGFVAVLAGWITTEVGRQPFTVYGVLRTSDSLGPVAAPAVAASLLAFIVVYFFVFGAGTFYILRMMNAPTSKPDPLLKDGPIRTAGITPIMQTGPGAILGE